MSARTRCRELAASGPSAVERVETSSIAHRGKTVDRSKGLLRGSGSGLLLLSPSLSDTLTPAACSFASCADKRPCSHTFELTRFKPLSRSLAARHLARPACDSPAPAISPDLTSQQNSSIIAYLLRTQQRAKRSRSQAGGPTGLPTPARQKSRRGRSKRLVWKLT